LEKIKKACWRQETYQRSPTPHLLLTNWDYNPPLSATTEIANKNVAICALLLLFPMQRLFEIDSIAYRAEWRPYSNARQPYQEIFSGAGFGQKGIRMRLLVSARGVGTEVDFSRSERLR
jgi:hypothetical protein